MAHAYGYMTGRAPKSRELELLDFIDRFGGQAVLGRPIYKKELRVLILAESIRNSYQALQSAGNKAKWAASNKSAFELLEKAKSEWQKLTSKSS